MRTFISIALGGLVLLCVMDQRVSGLTVQERQSVRALVNEFRDAALFWRQLDLAKKIVALQSPEVVSGLEPWLQHEDRHIRGNVGFVFAADPRAIGPLIAALRDSKALMRISAIHGLETLRTKEALPHLRALLNDRELPSAGDQVTVADTARAAILKLEREP